jgi:hypothetical protein
MEIEAKPTGYNGVVFRSKLEATWARFFDVIGLAWEYEPTQIPGWIPDFLIAGWWLAEVKPMPVIGAGADKDPAFQKAIRDFDTVLLGDGPGDALGMVVRRMDDGGVFSRYLLADLENGPAELHPVRKWPVGFHCPMAAIWRGVSESGLSWQEPPFRSVVLSSYREIMGGAA